MLIYIQYRLYWKALQVKISFEGNGSGGMRGETIKNRISSFLLWLKASHTLGLFGCKQQKRLDNLRRKT